jgi:dTDP-4-dehydrorhamnose 3,5-epimerase-like enzyme
MRMLLPYKQFVDNRGSFLGIINSGQWEEINYIETTAGQKRGGHYHKDTRELFFIIEGEIDITVYKIGADESVSYKVGKGAIFVIDPLEVHTFTCNTYCRWINVLSKRIDDQFNDIHLPGFQYVK